MQHLENNTWDDRLLSVKWWKSVLCDMLYDMIWDVYEKCGGSNTGIISGIECIHALKKSKTTILDHAIDLEEIKDQDSVYIEDLKRKLF